MKVCHGLRLTLAGLLLILLSGCQSTYYSAMEKVGIYKRDILVKRIESTQNAQEKAQEQFRSALEKFRSVVSFDGGDLEDAYSQLNGEYESSLAAAKKVRSRISDVQSVSEALFSEWQNELDQYSNRRLRTASERQLKKTRQSYQQMLASLKKAEQRMDPILEAFQDQVLYLKHNLNAQAIAALKGEFSSIKSDIERLIRDMQAAVDQSRKFIATLKDTP